MYIYVHMYDIITVYVILFENAVGGGIRWNPSGRFQSIGSFRSYQRSMSRVGKSNFPIAFTIRGGKYVWEDKEKERMDNMPFEVSLAVDLSSVKNIHMYIHLRHLYMCIKKKKNYPRFFFFRLLELFLHVYKF